MRYVHGKFELHKASRRLYFDGEPVQISQRGIDILLHLIELNGALASKKELLEAIWPGEAALESRLVKQISLLRRSMENISPESSIIVTIPGLGYRVERWEVRVPTAPTGEAAEQSSSGETSLLNRYSAITAEAPNAPPVIAAPSDPPPTHPSRLKAWLRRAAITIPLLLFSFYFFLSVISQIEVRYKFGPSRIVKARTSNGFKRSLHFSRNGRSLAYYQSIELEGPGQLVIVNLSNKSIAPLPSQWNADEEIAWSPDNQSIALLNSNDKETDRRQLMISSLDGRQIRNIGEVAPGGLDWAPDGQNLAVCEQLNGHRRPDSESILIHLLGADGSHRRRLTSPSAQGRVIESHPRFSPEGSRIAFIRHHPTDNRLGIHLVDLASGEERQVVAETSHISNLDWSPNGEEILFISNRSGEPRLWRVSTLRGARLPAPAPVTKIDAPLLSFSLSDEGELAYVCLPGNNLEIDLIPLPEGALKSFLNRHQSRDYVPCSISSSNSTYAPTFSPDGRQIAFISNRSGAAEIWSANSDCTNHRQLTFRNLSGIAGLNWSGDGLRIAFNQEINGQSDLFYLDLASGRIDQLTDSVDDELSPAWSPDSGSLYYIWQRSPKESASGQIRRLNLSANETDILVTDGGGRFAASSNQEQLYFTRQEQIWRKNLKTGEEQRLSTLDEPLRGVSWELNHDQLYLISRRAEPWPALFRLDLPSGLMNGRNEKVMELDTSFSTSNPGFAMSPNGRAIAITSISSCAREIRFLKYPDIPAPTED